MKKPLTGVAMANDQFFMVAALPEGRVVFACLWGGHARWKIGHLKFLTVKTTQMPRVAKADTSCYLVNRTA